MSTSHDPDTVQSVLFNAILQLVTFWAGSVVKENIDDADNDNDDYDVDDENNDTLKYTKGNKTIIIYIIIIITVI